MQIDDEPVVIVCMRIADLPAPHALSSPEVCGKCGARIWLADSTPRFPAQKLWCNHCFRDHGLDEEDGVLVTEEQYDIICRATLGDEMKG